MYINMYINMYVNMYINTFINSLYQQRRKTFHDWITSHFLDEVFLLLAQILICLKAWKSLSFYMSSNGSIEILLYFYIVRLPRLVTQIPTHLWKFF